jgi:ribosome biogenesis GTPase
MIDIPFERLRRIGLTPAGASRLAAIETSHPAARAMRVTETQRDMCLLHDGDDEHRARVLPRVVADLQSRNDAITIGDWVVAEPDASGDWWVAQRIDPVTQIARRANDGRRQTLASNVDTALLVMGLDADFNARRMERYIAMVRACDVVSVVVLTKADVAPNARAHIAEISRRLPATVPVLAVNGLSAQARHEIAPWLYPGCTLVLLGASGAGKSTLTNTLIGDAHQATGDVRKSDGRGRHTTTARSLHRLAEGACIIDTPGLRTWRPDADSETLAATFEDVQSLAMQCQFRDCRHEDEPGCAVRPAIAPDRLLNYQKLLRDAQRAEQTPLDRIALRRKWKKIGKVGTLRLQEKRQF